MNSEDSQTESGLGVSYSEKDKLLLCFELIHILDKTITRFGTEMNYKGLKIRLGSFNNFNTATFGFGFPLKSIEIDFATQWHSRLGFSPETSIYYAN